MATFNDVVCRLCHNLSSETTFISIDVKYMFDVVLPQLEYGINSEHICNICYDKLSAALEFKLKCFETETTIDRYLEEARQLPLDIMEIYMKEMEKMKVNVVFGDKNVCRLCLQLKLDEFVSVEEKNADFIQTCLPELNLEVTRDPKICKNCMIALYNHTKFLKNCLSTQTKIKIEVEDNAEESLCEPLSDVWVKNEFVEVKLEDQHKIETFLKEEELDINLKPESFNPCYFACYESQLNNARNRKSPTNKNPAELKIYKCKKCDYLTTYKTCFLSHLATHRNKEPEIKTFKCGKCDFESKYKNMVESHRLAHTDVLEVEIQPYNCIECSYRANDRTKLAIHQLKHTDMSKIKAYRCEKCDFQTEYKTNLDCHQLIHNDLPQIKIHKCKQCNFRTGKKRMLSYHQLRHRKASEEIYKCPDCDYFTEDQSFLACHRLVHTDVFEIKLYECTECDFQTDCRTELSSHGFAHREVFAVKTYIRKVGGA